MQAYSDPNRANDPHALPDLEVFELTAREVAETMDDDTAEFSRRPAFRLATINSRTREAMIDAMVDELAIDGGWFWQACFPGCLPDGDPIGPFASYADALADAQTAGLEQV